MTHIVELAMAELVSESITKGIAHMVVNASATTPLAFRLDRIATNIAPAIVSA